MIYITGIHALNLPCALETCGDWHTSALRWKDITFRESDDSIFGDYGIEPDHEIPDNNGKYYVANTLRALADLLSEGNFPVAQGAKEAFICNDSYTQEFFNLVYKLRGNSNWHEINSFMKKEYMFEWDNFVKEMEG